MQEKYLSIKSIYIFLSNIANNNIVLRYFLCQP